MEILKRLTFYLESIRYLGAERFVEEASRKFGAEFRYQRFLVFAGSAPADYAPRFALDRMGRSAWGSLRNRRFPLFFLEPGCREDYGRCLEEQGLILHKADRIVEGYLSVFGRNIRWDSGDFDWHEDPFSGWRWEANAPFYFREKTADKVVVPGRGDVRVIWEMSRLGCLVRLGQAWWLTGREKYSRTLARILDHWMEHNRPYRGVNWSSAMEAAIRAVNVIWSFFLFMDSSAASEEMVGKILSFLALSREFIVGLLERHFQATGNHYIANLVGLLYIDLLFPEISRFSKVDFAIKELAVEAEHQIYPDGVHFESSTAYHGLVLEMFLAAALLCQKNGRRLPGRFLNKITRMAAFTRDALPPSGRMIQLGDNDSGRLVELGTGDCLDHSRWCDVAALFTNNPSLASSMKLSAPETVWYLGPKSYQAHSETPYRHPQRSPGSANFPHSGFYFMKSARGWMSISCGPNGLYGRGAHAHNDKLSFELWLWGECFLIDPGTCVYTSDPALRNRFRSTAFHNTVLVDGKEQNRFGEDVFFLHNDSEARVLAWESNDEFDLFSGVHHGYERLSSPVTHRRDIRFDKKETSWRITDYFTGEGRHSLEWIFHLAPKIEVLIEDGKTIRLSGERAALSIRFDEPADIDMREGIYSPGYRRDQPSRIIRKKITAKLPCQFTCNLVG